MGARYRNVDLEIRSQSDLGPLRDGLGESVDVLYCGETEPESGTFLLSVELSGCGISCATDSGVPASGSSDADNAADATVIALCKLVDGLTDTARDAWNNAQDRMFDMGFDADAGDARVGQPLLSVEAIRQVARIGARLALSVYMPDNSGGLCK